MLHRLMGRIHASLISLPRDVRGQGTVEYVALILLVAVILAGVVKATSAADLGGAEIGKTIIKKLKAALDDVQGK